MRLASFFSGAMGLDLGMERAGFSTVFACEYDKWARATIAHNRPDLPLLNDIRDFDLRDFRAKVGEGHIDVVAGGPPCQAFSTAGKRRGFDDERGNVFLKYLDVIEQIEPTFFVIENVRGILSTRFELDVDEYARLDLPLETYGQVGSALLYTCKRMERMGYSVNFNLYNAANFGVPQKRERVIIIGSRIGDVPFLSPTHSEKGDFGLPEWRTLSDAIGDLDGADDPYLPLSEKTLKYLRMVKAGQNWTDLPQHVQETAMGPSYHLQGGKTGFYRRLSFEKPSPTLVTSPGMPATLLAHPVEDRVLTIKEYARIQQFPDEWKIQGSPAKVYKQVGNAVPVGLGEAIGKLIHGCVHGSLDANPEGFRFSRYRKTSYAELVSSMGTGA